eukprot:gene3731-6619_t
MECKKKIILSLSIDQSEREEIVIRNSEIDGIPVEFKEFKIRLQKTPPFANYALFYESDFPAQTNEQIIYRSDFLISSCSAGSYPDDPNPTCGWVLNTNREPIVDSQGFCCSCSLANRLGITKEGTRGKLNCDLFGPVASSAHCLRFSELKYHSFRLGLPEKKFEISIQIESNDTQKETLTLSPEVLNFKSSQVIGSLSGDFSGYKSIPDFQDKFLFVPLFPLSNERVKGGMKNWMLIDKLHVDKTGFTCNKIGVSYSAFRNQANQCGASPNDCLHNQVEDFHQGGSSFISKFGDFIFSNSSSENQFVLSKRINQFQPSVINLIINGDNLKYLINKSPGNILKVYVQKFESLSKNGKLFAQVQNTGSISSKYSVSITQCSSNINPILGQSLQLDSKSIKLLTFDVTTNSQLSSSNICFVRLYDSEGDVIDLMKVKFDTTETTHSNPGDPTKSDPSDPPTTGYPTFIDSTLNFFGSLFNCKCELLDVVCRVVSFCWIEYIIGLVITIAFIVFCVIFSLSDGWCCLFKTCRCMIRCNRCLVRSFGNGMNDISNDLKTPKRKKKSKQNDIEAPTDSSSEEEDEVSINFEKIIKKKKMIFLNIKKKDVKFLPKEVDETFSLAGFIKKEKLKGTTYYVFHLGSNTHQLYHFQESNYIDLETPEIIEVNSIKRLEKKKFISNVDVTAKPKYQRIN